MSQRAITWISSLALGAVFIGGGVWWFIDSQDSKGSEDGSWLFSHTADKGTLEQQSDGTYRLTMSGIDPHVMAFTDRPARDTQIIGIQALADSWDELFASAPPNAVLVEHNAQGEADSVVLELTSPEVEGDSITFSAQVLDEKKAQGVSGLAGTLHSEAPSTFNEASLFIDDIECPPDADPTDACFMLVYTSTFVPFDSSF
jgi:hypothetical protein